MSSKDDQICNYTMNEFGDYVPTIPEPFWVRHWLFWSRPGPDKVPQPSRMGRALHETPSHLGAESWLSH
jgi:hypothetical protein